MKRALIYARVSTLTQKADNTIERQVAACREYCKSQGYEIIDEYLDNGRSGASRERAFELESYVSEHRKNIDVVVFESIDRLSRDVMLCGYLETSLHRLGVAIDSVTGEDLEDNPQNNLIRTIVRALAQFEKENLVYKLKRGKRDRRKHGKRTDGKTPLGYTSVQEEIGGTRKKSVIDEREAAIVKEIFDTFQATRSTTRTAKAMNAKGYVNKRGAEFTKQGVQVMLQNDFYTGNVAYNGEKVDGQHPAIISKHQFTKVQRLFKQNAHAEPINRP